MLMRGGGIVSMCAHHAHEVGGGGHYQEGWVVHDEVGATSVLGTWVVRL